MGQASRTTKLLLDFSKRSQGGANPGKRSHLEATVAILNDARRFYLDFFLAHQDRLRERACASMGRSKPPALSLIRAWISIDFGISNEWRRSNGRQAAASKESAAIGNSGHIFVGKTWILLTRLHEPLSRCASSTLAVCWSLNVYARSKQKAAANRGGSIGNKPIN